ncbi:MAG: ABC transporter ATP-binding protein [Elainella sp. Prado103]|nr:ABC transporter ATP-binding protein [Elainella sp. Prado103]
MTYLYQDQDAAWDADQSPDQDTVLTVQQVSKKFCRSLRRSLFYGVQDIATELIGGRTGQPDLRYQEFWALQQVSLKLKRGEALGLIGANGSGKTTLLRIISGLIKPDTGWVRVRGKIAPLIALGAGFSPVLTGRENIYANMSILGLSTQQITQRFEQVVEFAEIGEAIDAPVYSYSSGMAARLGFSCAIHTDPEILLIDEVLAVGDIKFLARCHRRLHQLRQNGTAFVLVSHNPQAILSMCQQSVYLQKGIVRMAGETEAVMAQYEEDLFLGGARKVSSVLHLPPRPACESLGLDIASICFRNPAGEVLPDLTSGEPVVLCVRLQAHQSLSQVNLRLSFMEMSKDGQTTLYLGGSNDKEVFQVAAGWHELQVEFPYLGLAPGAYLLRVDIRREALFILDIVESFSFTVQSNGRMSKSSFYQPRSWRLVPQPDRLDQERSASDILNYTHPNI